MKKIIIALSIGVLFVSGGLLIKPKLSIWANEDEAKKKIVGIVNNENGEIIVKGTKQINEKLTAIALEDNKYSYEVSSNGDVIGFGINGSEIDKYAKVKGNLTEDEAVKKADLCLKKFATSKSKFVLKNKSRHADDAEDLYFVDYEGFAPNGVKTGDYVAIWINQMGDVFNYANHIGNLDVAYTSNPKLTKEDTHKIAYNKVLSYNGIDASKYPEVKCESELTVWEDKLIYDVTVKPVVKTDFSTTYFIKVDANSGEVINLDRTL